MRHDEAGRRTASAKDRGEDRETLAVRSSIMPDYDAEFSRAEVKRSGRSERRNAKSHDAHNPSGMSPKARNAGQRNRPSLVPAQLCDPECLPSGVRSEFERAERP